MRRLWSILLTLALAICMLCALIPMEAQAVSPTYTVSPSYRAGKYYQAVLNVELTGDQRLDLLNVARSQLGYCAGASANELGGDRATEREWTEYNLFYYGYSKEASWCAIFISWCARQARIPTGVIRTSGNASAGLFGCSWHPRRGYTPVPGDLIIFDWEGQYAGYDGGDHIGIVAGVTPTEIVTIEGNRHNAVERQTYPRDDERILGYAVPAYTSAVHTCGRGEPVGYGDDHPHSIFYRCDRCESVWEDTAADYICPEFDHMETQHPHCNVNRCALCGVILGTDPDSANYVSSCQECVDAGLVDPNRMAGVDRQETAVEISRAAFPDGSASVILASGDNYPDALAGGPLAYALQAPILLTRGGTADERTLDEIRRLGAGNVYLLGGEGVIYESVADELGEMGLAVERLAGPTRFETAVAIAEKLDELRGGKSTEAFFVYSHNYPDALSAGNMAALKGAPILYIQANGLLRQSTEDYLTGCGQLAAAYLLGGPGVVGPQAESSIGAYGPVERIYGRNRYETCLLVNRRFDDLLDSGAVCLARGDNYPDALAGSVFAANRHAPLLLVQGTLAQEQAAYIRGRAPAEIYAFGGTGVLPEGIVAAAREAAA